MTLDIDTSASQEWLKVEIKGSGLWQIDDEIGNLREKILTFFKTPPRSIYWDLAPVHNYEPSSPTSKLLVPKSFRFAGFGARGASDSGLSIFIHLEGGDHGGEEDEVQSHWTSQWSKYKVPPIPQSYTASIIFNNEWIKSLAEKAIEVKGMEIEVVPKTDKDTWGLKWMIKTGKKFKIDKLFVTHDETLYRIEKAVEVDLDEEGHRLSMTIGQNVRPTLCLGCVLISANRADQMLKQVR